MVVVKFEADGVPYHRTLLAAFLKIISPAANLLLKPLGKSVGPEPEDLSRMKLPKQ